MPLALNQFCVSLKKIPVILLINVNLLKAKMTLTSKHLKVVNSRHNSLVKKKQLHSYNPRKDMERRNGERPKSSSEVHKFNRLTFLACAKYEIPKFGTIPQITQIVHKCNDILVKEIKSAHDCLRCKYNNSKYEKS